MILSENKIRVGIPRALLYYNYAPLYETFFKELGAEVIVSHKTNKQIIADGISASNNELCLPLKILYGHIIDLKDRVDYIFLPYFISTHKGSYICPKITGAPDIIKASIDLKMISPDFDIHSPYSSMYSALKDVALVINLNPVSIYNAYNKAMKAQQRFEAKIRKGMTFDEAMKDVPKTRLKNPKMTLAIIGHSYVFNDEYISSRIFDKITKKNIKVVTSDMPSPDEIYSLLSKKRRTHWNLGDRVLGSAIIFSKKKDIDGIIYMTPFSCSSDSLVTEYMREHKNNKKPFMTITVDEHSGDAGLVTRLEAFIDMIERKNKMQNKGKPKKGMTR